MKSITKLLIILLSIIIGLGLLIAIFASLSSKGSKPEEYTEEKVVEKEKNSTKDKEKEKEDKKEEEDSDIDTDDPEVHKPYERQKILLDEIDEKFVVDDTLTIMLKGTKEPYGENMYTYNATFYVNDEITPNNEFNNVSDRVIYSRNHNAEFYVDHIDDVYIITSHIQKEHDGYYVSVINSDGELLREFNDITFELAGSIATVSLYTGDSVAIETRFSIEGKEINVIFEN